MRLQTGHNCFKDESGRTILLRGVNLGGSSKVPMIPHGATWNKAGFYDHRNVSFVGRPFPLAEADEHFHRLRIWGFTFLRFLVTWEAIEHAGPGMYDEEYLDYVYAIVNKADEHGFDLFIDPHQDVWSRFTGGDGAPGWTLEAAGFNLETLHKTGAAFNHQDHGDPYPRMLWATNYNKLAAGTMFTLFFAGNDFAPLLKVDGVPIQEYLQGHYINSIKKIAQRLKGLSNVVGYDTLNEPSNGFIGEMDIYKRPQANAAMKGPSPTIFQSMLLGAGYPQKVDLMDIGLIGFAKKGTEIINPEGVSAWMPGREDLWRQHGVWDVNSLGKPCILTRDHFAMINGRQVDFYQDYFKPFVNRFAREIRAVDKEALIFVEGIPANHQFNWNSSDCGNIVHAAHWYDDLTLFRKSYVSWLGVDAFNMKIVLGKKKVRECFAEQIASIIQQSDTQMNHAPTLIGEVGIPMDMGKKKAYQTGNFKMQIKALDTTMTALEKNQASFTLWNYAADNTNHRGDLWNDEDLSLFSRDQMSGNGSVYDGGRALQAAIRPYPKKVAGTPLQITFDINTRVFDFSFEHDDGIEAPTEIFVPALHYPDGIHVEISDGEFEYEPGNQLLIYKHSRKNKNHQIRLKPY